QLAGVASRRPAARAAARRARGMGKAATSRTMDFRGAGDSRWTSSVYPSSPPSSDPPTYSLVGKDFRDARAGEAFVEPAELRPLLRHVHVVPLALVVLGLHPDVVIVAAVGHRLVFLAAETETRDDADRGEHRREERRAVIAIAGTLRVDGTREAMVEAAAAEEQGLPRVVAQHGSVAHAEAVHLPEKVGAENRRDDFRRREDLAQH